MTKTICDICGKEMGNNKVGAIHELNFCISSYGKMWDVCNKCREELNEWINQHKMKSESKSDSGNSKPCEDFTEEDAIVLELC